MMDRCDRPAYKFPSPSSGRDKLTGVSMTRTSTRGLRAAMAGALLGSCLISTAAFAGVAFSAYSEMGPFGGYSYEYRTRVSTDNGGDANGAVQMGTKNGAQVPTGYIGTQASLWKSNGTLCVDTPWRYNPYPIVSTLDSTAGYGDCGAGNYYGDGQVAAYRPGAGIYAYGYPPGSPVQYQSN